MADKHNFDVVKATIVKHGINVEVYHKLPEETFRAIAVEAVKKLSEVDGLTTVTVSTFEYGGEDDDEAVI